MDIQSQLLAISGGVGRLVETPDGRRFYQKGEESLECIYDVLRLVRRDDPDEKQLYRVLGEWDFVELNLFPLLVFHRNDVRLCTAALKLAVYLTTPVEEGSFSVVQANAKVTAYKESFVRERHVAAALLELLAPTLERKLTNQLTDHDVKMIELIVTLFRNIVSMPKLHREENAAQFADRAARTVDAHMALVKHLVDENVLETLLVLCQWSAEDERFLRLNVLLLEVLCAVVRPVPAATAAASLREGAERVLASRRRETTSRLRDRLAAERGARQRGGAASAQPTRHSRFGGVYLRTGANNASYLTARAVGAAPPSRLENSRGVQRRHRPNLLEGVRAAGADATVRTSSALSSATTVTKVAKFAEEFLASAYNAFMESVGRDIERQDLKVLPADEINFAQLAAFFVAFHRAHAPAKERLDCGPIAATFSSGTVFFIAKQLDIRREAKEWNALPPLVALLREILRTAERVIHDGDHRSVARTLVANMVYQYDALALIVRLLREFKDRTGSIDYLRSLVELVDVLLRLLERPAGSGSSGSGSGGAGEGESGDRTDASAVPASEAVSGDVIEPDGGAVDAEDTGLVVRKTMRKKKSKNSRRKPGRRGDAVREDAGATESSDSESADSDTEQVITEREFEFVRFLMEFAHPHVIHAYVQALERFRDNTDQTNEHVVRFLGRIMDQLSLAPMLFQLSILQGIHEILRTPGLTAQEKERFRPVFSLCRRIVREFFDAAQADPVVYVEALFWKNRSDAMALASGGFDAADFGPGGRKAVHARFRGDADGADGAAGTARRWSDDEDRLLSAMFTRHCHLPRAMDVLACALQGRNAGQIARRLARHPQFDRAHRREVGRLAFHAGSPLLRSHIEEAQAFVRVVRERNDGGDADTEKTRGASALEWLMRKLAVVLSDRSASDAETTAIDIALVPLDDGDFAHLEGPIGQCMDRMLPSFGLVRPGSAQNPNAFWRIPAALGTDQLTTFLRVLQDEEVSLPELSSAETAARSHASGEQPRVASSSDPADGVDARDEKGGDDSAVENAPKLARDAIPVLNKRRRILRRAHRGQAKRIRRVAEAEQPSSDDEADEQPIEDDVPVDAPKIQYATRKRHIVAADSDSE